MWDRRGLDDEVRDLLGAHEVVQGDVVCLVVHPTRVMCTVQAGQEWWRVIVQEERRAGLRREVADVSCTAVWC